MSDARVSLFYASSVDTSHQHGLDGLDSALVHEDVFAEVTIDKLDTLSPAQLAIAAGRDDLDFLTKFRAGMDFLDRRSSFRAHCADQTSGTVPDPSGGGASEPTRCRGDHD